MSSFTRDQILNHVKDLVFNDKLNVTCNFISKKFHIHISEAIEVLEQFITKYKNDKISINYLLTGFDNSENAIVKLRRFSIVDENELESSKSSFDNVTSHVYSVFLKDNEQISSQFLNFDKFIFEPNSVNLDKVQSLTYINNCKINVRPMRRSCASVYIDYDLFGKESSQTVKQEEPELAKEPMEVDLKETLQNKRQNSKGNDYSDNKKYKRVKILDSDDEDESKMKENVKSEPNENEEKFTVTKVENSDLKLQIKSEKNEKSIKPKQQTNGNLKVKLQTQTSITSFFKKPSK